MYDLQHIVNYCIACYGRYYADFISVIWAILPNISQLRCCRQMKSFIVQDVDRLFCIFDNLTADVLVTQEGGTPTAMLLTYWSPIISF